MVTIQKDTAILTLVNVFHVKPERQQAVADVLIEAGKTMSQLPGFISANIHTSHDGNRWSTMLSGVPEKTMRPC